MVVLIKISMVSSSLCLSLFAVSIPSVPSICMSRNTMSNCFPAALQVMGLNIAICDDEKVIREQIKELAEKEMPCVCDGLYETGDALLAAGKQFDMPCSPDTPCGSGRTRLQAAPPFHSWTHMPLWSPPWWWNCFLHSALYLFSAYAGIREMSC